MTHTKLQQQLLMFENGSHLNFDTAHNGQQLPTAIEDLNSGAHCERHLSDKLKLSFLLPTTTFWIHLHFQSKFASRLLSPICFSPWLQPPIAD